jgi:hypothetical protein
MFNAADLELASALDLKAAGTKPEGARVEFCWLLFERHYAGPPQLGWLLRDGSNR